MFPLKNKVAVVIAVLSLNLGYIQPATADEGAPFILKCDCQSVSEFNAAIVDDMLARRDVYDYREGAYLVISETDAKIAVAKTWFSLWFVPYQGFTYVTNVDMLTDTEQEMAFMDQYMIARAAYAKAHRDELPTVTYPNSAVHVDINSTTYQDTAYLYMNGHPAVKMVQLGEEVAWSVFRSKVDSFIAKLASLVTGEVLKPYVKLAFADGSYGVFCVVDSTTAGVHAVYYVDKDGNVVIIDEELLEGIEDPNIASPKESGDVNDVPHQGTTTWEAGVVGSGASASIVIYAPFSGSSGGAGGRVFIDDLLNSN